MKRFFITSLLALVMLIYPWIGISLTVSAEETGATITFSEAAAYKGETVEIRAVLSGRSSIKSMALVPQYDSDALEYVHGEWLVGNALMSDWSDTEKNGVILFSSAKDLNGEIALFRFRIKESDSWEEIPFTCRAVMKNGEQELDIAVIPSVVRILCDHIWAEETFTQDATCTQVGRTYKRCTVCGTENTLSTLEKLPHTPGDWVTDVEATVGGSGLRHKNCTVCGEKVAEEQIPPLGECVHVWSEEVYLKKADCSTKGCVFRVCLICNTQMTLYETEKTPHLVGEWIADPLENSDVQTWHRECSECGKVIDTFSTVPSEIITSKPDEDVNNAKASMPPWLVGVIAGVAGAIVGAVASTLTVFLIKRRRI